MNQHKPDSTITLRDIVEAFAEQKRHHSEDGGEFSDYHDLKVALL